MIARSLLDGPKKLIEIKEKTKLDAVDLNEAIKGLIKLRVVETVGQKYKLIDAVTKALSGVCKFEAIFIIEGVAGTEEVVKKRMKILEEKIRLKIKPKKIYIAEPVFEDKQWSMFIEFTSEFKNIHELISAIVNYGPSSVEILRPQSVELDSYNLQRLSSDLTSAVHYYATVILNATLYIEKLRGEVARLQDELAKTLQEKKQKSPKNSTSKAKKSA